MSKCEHGLTIKECYVCISPKYGEHDIKQECVAKPQEKRHEWVGLTDEEIKKFWRDATVKPCYTSELIDTFAKAVEAKLREKNT